MNADAIMYKQRTNAINDAFQTALHTRGCNRLESALMTVCHDAVALHKDATTNPKYIEAKKVVRDVDASIKDASSTLRDAMGMLGLREYECDEGVATIINSYGYDLVSAFEDNKTLIRDNLAVLLRACKVDVDALPEGKLKTTIMAYKTTTPGSLRQKH